jgi:hypothetical protein
MLWRGAFSATQRLNVGIRAVLKFERGQPSYTKLSAQKKMAISETRWPLIPSNAAIVAAILYANQPYGRSGLSSAL